MILALISGIICSFFRTTSELVGEDYIRQFNGQTVVITGTVDGDPDSDESATKFKLKNLRFGTGNETHQISGNIYISAKQTDQIHRSDDITLVGKLSEGFGTYAGFMYRPVIDKISRPDPGDPIIGLRNWFSRRITSKIQDPESALGVSYLLGMKTNLSDELNENLRLVGLVHIVVASGAHLSILVDVARKIFGKISRFSSLLFSLTFVLLFMAMVGFTPSIMRAGIMSILSLAAWYVGRKFAAWRIILIVAAITLIINPMFIVNLGWLLSFASFAGIMILGPRLTAFFYGDRSPGFVASIILTTVSATLMTIPITLYFFGTFSLISILANLLILPTLPIAMGLTFFTGALADIPIINTVASFLTTKILDFHIMVVDFFAAAKSFLITIDPYNPWVFVIYVPVIIMMLCGILAKSNRGNTVRDSSEVTTEN